MKGWSEEEFKNRDLMAPCGLYCGACGVYIATRDNNSKFRGVMASLYGTKPEDTECCGCMQKEPVDKLYAYCRSCPMRECVKSRGLYSCHQCKEWPCALVEGFAFDTGKRVMKRAIPVWREKVMELGDEKGSEEWARCQCEHYHCPTCGEPLFRGAQRCRSCKTDVSVTLDGSNG